MSKALVLRELSPQERVLLDHSNNPGPFARPMYFSRQGSPLSLYAWAQLIELGRRPGDDRRPYYRVAQDRVRGAWVSTVWLGIDHGFSIDPDWRRSPPVIFESMVFCDDPLVRHAECRYHTEQEALAGHFELVAWTDKALTPFSLTRLRLRWERIAFWLYLRRRRFHRWLMEPAFK